MANVKPFPALRPKAHLAAKICELPYDVMSSNEARQIAANNPLSFLHVSKAEIDLPEDVSPHAPEVYATARTNFLRLIQERALNHDAAPHFYLYRQTMGSHTQTGVVAVASCAEYLNNIVRKHELTRPDKEDDRVRHIETLNAQTGPVFLTYRAQPEIDRLVAEQSGAMPEIDFTADDGVRHTAWTVTNSSRLVELERLFSKVPVLYIADGHHRSAAAARVFEARQGAGQSGFFLSVIFPHNQLQILPYNRVLKDLNGHTPERLLEMLDGVFVIHKNGKPKPERKHELCLFFQGQWQTLSFRPRFASTTDPIEKLDVTLLQKYVLDPVFGIHDPRTSERISFVGGIRGPAELERLVRGGEFACAFSMFPTGIEDLMSIADAGGIMPPKSTWFEPKLRDAMFCHLI